VIQNHQKRVSTVCQERQELLNEITGLRRDLQRNGYPIGFTDSVNSKGSSRLNTEENPSTPLYIPYENGVFTVKT
jgi:hypothetical protein